MGIWSQVNRCLYICTRLMPFLQYGIQADPLYAASFRGQGWAEVKDWPADQPVQYNRTTIHRRGVLEHGRPLELEYGF